MAIDEPTILYIQKGYKILRWRGQELTIYAGEMVLLSAEQNLWCVKQSRYRKRLSDFPSTFGPNGEDIERIKTDRAVAFLQQQ